MPETRSPGFTAVNLLTGFLGAGKTTLLQRLLRDPALADTAVLINEFGEVGLDHHLLDRIDATTVLLQSGCLCCTIRGELADAMRGLHEKRERGQVAPFRRLVIESTGLADPFPILTTLHADPVLRHHYRTGNIVCVVDAAVGALHLARGEAVKQVAAADRIVLAKTDIAAPADARHVMGLLRAINPAAPVLRATEDALDADMLLARDAVGSAAAAQAGFMPEEPAGEHAHDRNRHGSVRAFALTLDRPLDWTAFGVWLSMLLHAHGGRVLRVKGILNVGDDDPPVAIHGVQHLVHPPVHMRGWPDGDRRSRLVFITDGLERGAVEASLLAFTSPESSAGMVRSGSGGSP